MLAVDGDHQRGGVGDHDVVRARRGVDARALLRGDAALLVLPRRAAVRDRRTRAGPRGTTATRRPVSAASARAELDRQRASCRCFRHRAGRSTKARLMRRRAPAPPGAPADHRQQRRTPRRAHRQPQALVGEQRHADHVDDHPDRPVLDVLAAQQPLADHAAGGREGVPPGHVGVGDALRGTGASSGQATSAPRPAAEQPRGAERAHAQRRAVGLRAAQPLPPAPHGDDDEEELQAGLAVQPAVPEQQRSTAASSTMASGQPSGLTRMLNDRPSPARARRPTSSSQVTGAPHSVKAAANSGRSACSSVSISGARRTRSALRRGDLHEDLVGLDHAELEAGLLLDHLQAFLQVAHFGQQLRVARCGARR